MKRDMNLIRAIVLGMRDGDFGDRDDLPGFCSAKIGRQVDEDEFGYHGYLVVDAGLAGGADVRCMGDAFPNWEPHYLTWAGQEFAMLAESDETWLKFVGAAKEKSATLSFEFVKAGLVEFAKFGAKQLAASQFGFPT